MKPFWKSETLSEQTKQQILHNGKDMANFYTLTPKEREDVLERIAKQDVDNSFWNNENE